jgi:hypothetical protein
MKLFASVVVMPEIYESLADAPIINKPDLLSCRWPKETVFRQVGDKVVASLKMDPKIAKKSPRHYPSTKNMRVVAIIPDKGDCHVIHCLPAFGFGFRGRGYTFGGFKY